MLKDGERYLPYSGRRYIIDQCGNLLDSMREAIPAAVRGDELTVEISWVFGTRGYSVGMLVLVTYHIVDIPNHLWLELQPLYKDGDFRNNSPGNLSYRYRNGPLEVEHYPGYFYIPFTARYAINRVGQLITVETGRIKAWTRSKPCQKRNSTGGYCYTRIMAGERGHSVVIFRHRALGLVFVPYPANVAELVINHKDGDPSNDVVDNVEWVTHAVNNQHAYDMGLRPNSSKPILVWDLTTDTITKYRSIALCNAALTWSGNTSIIGYRLNHTGGKVYADKLLFKYDDGSEWAVLDYSTAHLTRVGAGKDILARNVFTGKVCIFSEYAQAEKITGVMGGTIARHVRDIVSIPIHGYNFRYSDEPVVWPVHTARHLEVYAKHPVHPRAGVIVINVDSGEELFFTSKQEACLYFDMKLTMVESYCAKQHLYKRIYKFTTFYLHETAGPAQ